MAFEPNNLRPIARNSQTGSTIWIYHSTVDTIVTMLIDDYFEAQLTGLAVNDAIVMVGTDNVSFQAVNTVGASPPNAVTLKSFRGIAASSVDVLVDAEMDAGGTPPQPFVQNVLQYLVSRMNLKIQDGFNVGTGHGVLKEIDRDTEPTANRANFRTISSSTLTIVETADEITINT
jgi:hypothetical protein